MRVNKNSVVFIESQLEIAYLNHVQKLENAYNDLIEREYVEVDDVWNDFEKKCRIYGLKKKALINFIEFGEFAKPGQIVALVLDYSRDFAFSDLDSDIEWEQALIEAYVKNSI